MVSKRGQLIVVDADTVQSTQRLIYEELLARAGESDVEILRFLRLPPDQPQRLPLPLLTRLNLTAREAAAKLPLDHYYGCLTLRELLRSLNGYCAAQTEAFQQN